MTELSDDVAPPSGDDLRLTISLIAHTNVGKTTLARTLLRRDVGEVFDQAHVTEVAEAYPLIEAEGARLFLWDTPGLGDTVRLVRRLRGEGSPIGWFLHQVWDKRRDRPLWCSQEALRNVREDADVVLYVVNAGEAPEDAGYVPLELEVLEWLGKPTLVLLNQTGGTLSQAERLTAEWRAFLADRPVVRDVLALDAFGRSWLQEDALFEALVPLFDGERRAAMRRLADAWSARNRAVFERAMEALAGFLAEAAADHERLPPETRRAPQAARARAEALLERIEARETALWRDVVAWHGLEGRLGSEVRGLLDAVAPGIHALGLVDQLSELFEENRSTVTGAAGGLLTIGLAADVLSGGLTLGGGALVGGLLGGAMGRLLDRRRGRERREERDVVRLSEPLLERLTVDGLRRYLLLACYGRGRGDVQDSADQDRWRAPVEAALTSRADALARALDRARREGAAAAAPPLSRALADAAEELLRQ